jgi:zinc-ribbon domain
MAATQKRKSSAPSECPVCGAGVPPNARACPECGADDRAGWNDETTRYDGLDLPDEAFEDEGHSAKHPASRGIPRPNGTPVFWWLVALGVLALLIAATLGLRI